MSAFLFKHPGESTSKFDSMRMCWSNEARSGLEELSCKGAPVWSTVQYPTICKQTECNFQMPQDFQIWIPCFTNTKHKRNSYVRNAILLYYILHTGTVIHCVLRTTPTLVCSIVCKYENYQARYQTKCISWAICSVTNEQHTTSTSMFKKYSYKKHIN